MNNRWWLKKKLWVALITGMAYAIGSWTGNEAFARGLLELGMVVIAGLGLEDFGKARNEILIDEPVKK